MSYVEFQHVNTSHGIMRGLRARLSSTLYHLGRTMVDEFLIALDKPRSCRFIVDLLSDVYVC